MSPSLFVNIVFLLVPQLTGDIERIQLVEKASKKGVNEGGRLMHHARRERLSHSRSSGFQSQPASLPC